MKDYHKMADSLLKRIQASNIPSENKKAIKSFDEMNRANKKGGSTRFNYLIYLKRLADFFPKKPFKRVNKKNMTTFVNEMDKKYTGKTTQIFRINIKAFYRWLEGDDERYPKKVSWIKNHGSPKPVLPSDLPTTKDIEKMIKVCDNPRDKLIISLLAELGFRAGELESIRLKDVQFMDNFALVTVRGKTAQGKAGIRTLRVYDSEPLLKLLYSLHPKAYEDINKNRNNEEPLFYNMNKINYGNPLGYMGIYGVVRKAARRVGLKLRPHLYRHLALTRMGRHMKDAELRVFAGWSAGSQQTKTYIHLTPEEIQEKQGQIQGDEPVKVEKSKLLPVRSCWKCKSRSPKGGIFCAVCGSVLDKAMRDKHEAERFAVESREKRMLCKEMDGLKKKHDKTMEMVADLVKKHYPGEYKKVKNS